MKKLDAATLYHRVEERAAANLAEGNIGGASVGVWQAGAEVFRAHFGTRSPDTDEPLAEGAIFRLASMTKPITAAAILLLEDRGLLSIDDPVCRYLPAFSEPYMLNESGERVAVKVPITVRHLLSHTSGYGWAAESGKLAADMTEHERTEVRPHADFFARVPLSFAPGARQEYSATVAFSILTAVAEQVTGMDFADLLQKEIFDPCGMTDTTFSPTEEQWARMVGMHNKKDGCAVQSSFHPGDGETRTHDLLNAIQALSQLSYAPMQMRPLRLAPDNEYICLIVKNQVLITSSDSPVISAG